MSFFDVFLSEKARARKARRKRRHALREAEGAVEAVKARARRLDADAKKRLAEAREAKKAGDRAAASRALVSARAAMALAVKLEQKRWVFEQYLVKMEVAQSDGEFASALAAMNKVVAIDPERVEDVFDAAGEKLGEALDADAFWSRLYEKEMDGAATTLEDYVPSIEELDRETDADAAPAADAVPASPAAKGRFAAPAATPVADAAPTAAFSPASDTGVTFDDIDGMDEAKAAIRERIILPLQAPEKARALGIGNGGGVLLYGPPGNGKTLFGKAIAHEIKAPFYYATGAQIRSKWHGESEQRLAALFAAARANPVAVVFLDEVDGLLARRTDSSSPADTRIVTQFLSEVGGFAESDCTLLLLGATNKPWDIDEAVFRTGRFDEKLHIGAPDAAARLGMLRRALKTAPLAPDADLPALASGLENRSGSDIVAIARKACQTAFRRSMDEDAEPLVLAADLADAARAIPSSITPALLARYDAFDKQRFG